MEPTADHRMHEQHGGTGMAGASNPRRGRGGRPPRPPRPTTRARNVDRAASGSPLQETSHRSGAKPVVAAAADALDTALQLAADRTADGQRLLEACRPTRGVMEKARALCLDALDHRGPTVVAHVRALDMIDDALERLPP